MTLVIDSGYTVSISFPSMPEMNEALPGLVEQRKWRDGCVTVSG